MEARTFRREMEELFRKIGLVDNIIVNQIKSVVNRLSAERDSLRVENARLTTENTRLSAENERYAKPPVEGPVEAMDELAGRIVHHEIDEQYMQLLGSFGKKGSSIDEFKGTFAAVFGGDVQMDRLSNLIVACRVDVIEGRMIVKNDNYYANSAAVLAEI